MEGKGMTEETKKTILEKSRETLCDNDDDYATLKEVIWSEGFEECAGKTEEEYGEGSSFAEYLTMLYVGYNFELRKAAEGKTEKRLRIQLPLSAYKTNEDIAKAVNSNPDQYVLYEPNESKRGYVALYIVNGKGELERI
jgi:hypothetical protein